MAKRSLTKKKGPKGKKARKAAKLERQWGENVDEEEIQRARIRKGKSRLVNHAAAIESRSKSVKIENSKELHDGYRIDSDQSEDECEVSVDEGKTLASLLMNIQKCKSGFQRESNFDDNSFREDDDISNHSGQESEISDGDITNEGTADEIGFDFESLSPKGKNLYLSHFEKHSLPDEENDESANKECSRIAMRNLNENIVVQGSFQVKERYQNGTASLAMDSFSHVRKNIAANWAKVNSTISRKNIDGSKEANSQSIFSELQAAIYPAMANYCDSLITCMNQQNRKAFDNILALHILNHVLTANSEITSHNNIIREMEKKEDLVDTEKYRDQGYTRPKVLILLPTRSFAHYFMKTMIAILGDNCSIENEERFEGEFGPVDAEFDEANEADQRRRVVQKAKGSEWLELFADGVNSDDDFKIGITISNMKKGKKSKLTESGVAVKFFSDFYHSDIIIASPLGLKIATNNEYEEDGDTDFLSSIEVVIAHHCDILMMQNWDHMTTVMDRLNGQPKKNTGIDFSRVRHYLLSGQASRWRQIVFVSRFSDPYIVSTFNRHSKSIEGLMKIRRKVLSDEGSICNVLTKVRQVFQRVSSQSFASQGESKVKYFKDVILPQLIRTTQKHTLIFIPSYFDFISIRNIMLKHEIASNHFVSVTEYSRVSEVSRGRARFMQGRKRIMLYTGRAHFFMRHHIKGAKHLIMIGLPEYAEFYSGLLNMLSDETLPHDIESSASGMSCLNIFTKYDAQSLERIVGTKYSERMIKSEKKTFLFSS
jgi:U3 small nucleolar RNA-associated protein 25